MERIREEQWWLVTSSLVVLASVAIATALVFTRPVMVPFVLAVFIATITAPIVDHLVVRLHWSQPLAVTIAVFILLLVFSIAGVLLIAATQTVVVTAAEYSDSFANMAADVFAKLKTWHIDVDEASIVTQLRESAPQIVTQTAGTALGLLSNGALILIFVVFLLAGRNPFAVREGVYAEIDSKIRSYLVTKVAISAATGVIVWWILKLFGLPMASVFAILAFALNFIPSIGSVIATLLPIPVAIAHFDNPAVIVAVIALPGLAQMIVGNVVEPRLLGNELQIHPVTVLLALAFWGLLWGLIGMMLAVPITASIRLVLIRFETTRPIGDLLAGTLPGGSPANGSDDRNGNENAASSPEK